MNIPVSADLLALQRLYHWERTAPTRIAFTQPTRGGQVVDLTWQQVMDQSRRVAAYLRAQGLKPGARIALLSKNTAHWMMSDYAIWLAGLVSVPLYPTLTPASIRRILEHSGAELLFVGKVDGWDGMKPGIPQGLPCISHPLAPDDARASYRRWDDIVAQTEPLAGEPVRAGDDLATLMYTSGTTGTPKGVMLSFAALAWAVQTALKRVPMTVDSRMLSYLPLSHIVERALVEHGQLATAMRVYFAESLDTFTADLRRARPTIFFSVPRLWVKFKQGVEAKMAPSKLDLLLKIPVLNGIVRKKILSALGLQDCVFAAGGAAPMPIELLRWYARLGLNIAEGYGMTENCAASHLGTSDGADFGTVGRPYDGVQCRIVQDSGEILVNSPANMLGYYRDAALTQAALDADGWLHTGDKGEIDDRGRLKITGRVKDLFKTSKGKYVDPAPIEDQLATHRAVEACCVTGANLGQPLALVMLGDDARASLADANAKAALEASLAAHLHRVNAKLDPHEKLACLVVTAEPWSVDNDLVTPTFKVKRNSVEALFAKHYERWVAQKSPVVWVA